LHKQHENLINQLRDSARSLPARADYSPSRRNQIREETLAVSARASGRGAMAGSTTKQKPEYLDPGTRETRDLIGRGEQCLAMRDTDPRSAAPSRRDFSLSARAEATPAAGHRAKGQKGTRCATRPESIIACDPHALFIERICRYFYMNDWRTRSARFMYASALRGRSLHLNVSRRRRPRS